MKATKSKRRSPEATEKLVNKVKERISNGETMTHVYTCLILIMVMYRYKETLIN
jgi:hypothetical protein